MNIKTILFTMPLEMDSDPGYGEHIPLDLLMSVFEHQRKINPDANIRVAINKGNELELYTSKNAAYSKWKEQSIR